ncbi:gamma-glutamyltransferase [Alkalilimnicola ehrlichii MLHE-1]|uniref:Glutathione hydrolase proenzyme n=1 Tax=Alkalilimnicola ehrlichii (strain ATCC BAA-1101 / DSM 17681 / MLHE-1) TaxID=187272 RepID=Q0A593_ALKEH|nr:gamma-glutamyltransferase [Alkalilimnicola ehrlichii]ABI57994.1 gamma-glutamyltransferase 1 [Alkalilimnicola ehrlichii MLHE-1]
MRRVALVVGLLLCWAGEALATPPPAVASAHPRASAAAMEVMAQGGNAFDAAVTLTATLAVVEPYGSGIGGGGFWLLHRAADGHEVMLDGRETAPGAAYPDMYLDDSGELDRERSLQGGLAAAIPGTPAAMVHLAREYGALPLAESLAPAIRLARQGFQVDSQYRRMALFRVRALNADPEARRIFLRDRIPPPQGSLLRQPDLADSLERIAEHGLAGFYEGPVAEALVAGVRATGGIWTLDDLAGYRVVEREPVRGRMGDLRITAAAPPSAGGVGLVGFLQMLADDDWQALSRADRVHLTSEAMRRVYRDRAAWLGDPDFTEIPMDRLLSAEYARALRAEIDMAQATPSTELPVPVAGGEGRQTTHFSVVDGQGNRVAATLSINYPFGATTVPPGTGVLLNNEMDDFATALGEGNVYGLLGTEPNRIEPGKRPLSSMTPAFLEDECRTLIYGTPGGSRIVTMVMLGALGFLEATPLDELVAAPRYHHQYLPDEIQHEPGAFSRSTRADLQGRGHRLRNVNRRYGDMQALLWDHCEGRLHAASDPRGIGAARVAE